MASHPDWPRPHAHGNFAPEGNRDRGGGRRRDRAIRGVGHCRDTHRSSNRHLLFIPGVLRWALDAQLALRAEHLPERLDAHFVGPFSVALVVPGSPQLLTNIHRAIVILFSPDFAALRTEREGGWGPAERWAAPAKSKGSGSRSE